MTRVEVGKGVDGKDVTIFINHKLGQALDIAINRVKNLNWDYVAIIAGIPGSGKSTFTLSTLAKYVCPWFDTSYVAFTDEEFIKITNNAPEFSAVVLDESFQSLNSRVTMSRPFLRIINHLQLLRQKHLFIFLCLPNYFDLSKGVAIFRSSHLFVVYDEMGHRGKFLAFGRNEKRNLYLKGGKYINYNAVKANFFGRFAMNTNAVDLAKYEIMKKKNLMQQEKGPAPKESPYIKQLRIMMYRMHRDLKISQKQIGVLAGKSASTVCEDIKWVEDNLIKTLTPI